MIYGSWFRNKMEKPIPGYEEFQKFDKGQGLYNKYANNKVDLFYEGEKIPEDKFSKDEYCNEIFGKKVKEIGRNCFYQCPNLIKAFLPNVVKVEQHALSGCLQIKSINLPKAINILPAAFRNCSNLIEISVPETIEASNYLFSGCEKLKKISLPKATRVGYEAFYGCSLLEFLSVPIAADFDNTCFRGCRKLEKIECKRGMKDKVLKALQDSQVSTYRITIEEI